MERRKTFVNLHAMTHAIVRRQTADFSKMQIETAHIHVLYHMNVDLIKGERLAVLKHIGLRFIIYMYVMTCMNKNDLYFIV